MENVLIFLLKRVCANLITKMWKKWSWDRIRGFWE